jgi:predicted dehydrogenase
VLNVGLLGCGNMGSGHAEAWSKLPGTRLAGVYDARPAAAKAMAGRFKARFFATAEEMAADPDIQAVDICAPTFTHASFVHLACRHSKAILCEKPLARSRQDFEAIQRSLRHSRVPFMAAQVVRYFPEYRQAREVLRSGQIGRLRFARLSRRVPRPAADWYYDWDRAGGCLVDVAVHDLDFACWAFGKPLRTFFAGPGRSAMKLRTDQVFGQIEFAGGVQAQVECAWTLDESFETRLELSGDRGKLYTRSGQAWLVLEREGKGVKKLKLAGVDPWYEEIRDFAKAVVRKQRPPVDLKEVEPSMKLVYASMESMEEGRWVGVGE